MKRVCDRLACIVLLTLTPGWAAASLQDQIDAAWRAGGGEVVVPAGEHRLCGGQALREVMKNGDEGVVLVR